MSDPWNAVPWLEMDVSQELATKQVDSADNFSKFIKESNSKTNNKRIWKSHAPWINFPAAKIRVYDSSFTKPSK